jgi:chitinase
MPADHTYFLNFSYRCSNGPFNARYICCPAWTGLTPETCDWDAGKGNVKTDCSGKCKVGEIKVLGDSDGWEGDLKTGKYGFHCLR